MRVIPYHLFLLSLAVTFTCGSSLLTSLPSPRPTKIALFARRKPTNKQATPAGGFGKSSSADANQDKNRQSRSISGNTGSVGTKPLRVAANTFDKIRKQFADSEECLNDVYIRSPLNDETTFWFVGKVARCLEGQVGSVVPTPEEAVLSQKRLILEYAKHELRPQNMGGPYAQSLELWLAPGNSEMSVVQNKITLEKVEGSVSNLRQGFQVADVGFNPEIYLGDEIQKGGLRVTRDEEGRPIKPVFEITEPA
jgi:hypothetical protein